jgi:hypothetical protein
LIVVALLAVVAIAGAVLKLRSPATALPKRAKPEQPARRRHRRSGGDSHRLFGR